jgi:hypothetical protein
MLFAAAALIPQSVMAQTYNIRYHSKWMLKGAKPAVSPSPTPSPSPAPTPTPAPSPTPTPTPTPTDPSDLSNPAPPVPESQVKPSVEPTSPPPDYQAPTVVPKPSDSCEADSSVINDATANAMSQKVSFWFLGWSGWIIRASIWRIRNANAEPITVRMTWPTGAREYTIPAKRDIIGWGLQIGWFNASVDHGLYLKRGNTWVLVDRKTTNSQTINTSC